MYHVIYANQRMNIFFCRNIYIMTCKIMHGVASTNINCKKDTVSSGSNIIAELTTRHATRTAAALKAMAVDINGASVPSVPGTGKETFAAEGEDCVAGEGDEAFPVEGDDDGGKSRGVREGLGGVVVVGGGEDDAGGTGEGVLMSVLLLWSTTWIMILAPSPSRQRQTSPLMK